MFNCSRRTTACKWTTTNNSTKLYFIDNMCVCVRSMKFQMCPSAVFWCHACVLLVRGLSTSHVETAFLCFVQQQKLTYPFITMTQSLFIGGPIHYICFTCKRKCAEHQSWFRCEYFRRWHTKNQRDRGKGGRGGWVAKSGKSGAQQCYHNIKGTNA